jgi:DNA-binding MarR family transcriptional regulator
LSPSASSYHLRELAKYGLVEQAPSRGDGRERVWRSTGTGLRIEGEADEPEAMAAEHELIDAYVVRDFNRTREWAARQGQESKEWREASSLMSQKLLLTAGELAAVNEQVSALLEPYRMRGRLAAPPDGGREVAVFYAAFPTR